MDEITLVRELGEETALPSADRLAAARARLMAEVAPRPVTEVAPRPVARRRLWAVLGAGAAVTATAAAMLIPGSPTPVPPAAPAMAPVAVFLNEVASTAEQADDITPRDDQYVYTKSAADGSWIEFWNSVDGRHDTVTRQSDGKENIAPGCADGRTRDIVSGGREVESPCEPLPHYLPDLPSDPAALITWVERRNPDENGGVNVNGVGKELLQLVNGHWLRPAQRAALYRAVGTIDGISLVPNAKDGAGRTGTGVAWATPGSAEPEVMWVFDTETHAFLGGPNYSIVTPLTIVDRVGQRP
jgi:hypothetical protein